MDHILPICCEKGYEVYGIVRRVTLKFWRGLDDQLLETLEDMAKAQNVSI
jgi:hypothetical protein